MRYYDIAITNAQSGQIIRPASLASLNLPTSYTSFVNGQSIPGSLDIELDIAVSPAHQPIGESYVRIWGVSLQEIAQASDLNGALIVVKGGFQKGLPLANPQQAGPLVSGYILQAFGNWVGTEMTLDLVIAAGKGPKGLGSPTQPVNLVLNWRKGTALGQAIQNALLTAYPGSAVNVQASSNLILSSDQIGYYNSLTELAQYAYRVSRSIINTSSYQGLSITGSPGGNQFYVLDGTQTNSNVININFNDLIGQPTWFASQQVSFKCPMRADLKVTDQIMFPVGPGGLSSIQSFTTSASQSQYRSKSVFQGSFQIQKVRHLGHFRQRSGDSWVTTYEAFANTPATTTAT